MHWKLTTRATGFLQINAVLPQSQTRVVTSALSAPDGPGNGVAHPKRYHTAIWQPVLSGNRPAQNINHPYNRNPAKQIMMSCNQTRSITRVPVDPRGARTSSGQLTRIPHSLLAAYTSSEYACTGYQPLVQQKSCTTNHDAMQSVQGHHQCPSRPQRDQDEVWPAYTYLIQCVGSLYSVGIGLHRISTTRTTEILQNKS